MSAKGIDRAAYVAAHRIVEANIVASELVCPGGRRSRAVDTVAAIIREVFEAHWAQNDDCIERDLESGLRVVNSRRTSTVLRLPSRGYPNEVA